MLAIFWACLVGGFVLTLLLFLFGDLVEGLVDALDAVDGLFDPLSLVGGIAAFGGSGILLAELTDLSAGAAVVPALALGALATLAVHFAYVRPMKRSENSSGFSLSEYRGKLGEVLTTIPAVGYGEVLVRMGAANTFRQAASFDGEVLPAGTPVVVIDVRDGDLLVARFEDGVAPAERLPAATPAVPQLPVST